MKKPNNIIIVLFALIAGECSFFKNEDTCHLDVPCIWSDFKCTEDTTCYLKSETETDCPNNGCRGQSLSASGTLICFNATFHDFDTDTSCYDYIEGKDNHLYCSCSWWGKGWGMGVCDSYGTPWGTMSIEMGHSNEAPDGTCPGKTCNTCTNDTSCTALDYTCLWDYKTGLCGRKDVCIGRGNSFDCSFCTGKNSCTDVAPDLCAWDDDAELCRPHLCVGPDPTYDCNNCTDKPSCKAHNNCAWDDDAGLCGPHSCVISDPMYDCNNCTDKPSCRTRNNCAWDDNGAGLCWPVMCTGTSCETCTDKPSCGTRNNCAWDDDGTGRCGRADTCTGVDCSTCGGRTSCTALGNNCAWDDGTGFGLCGTVMCSGTSCDTCTDRHSCRTSNNCVWDDGTGLCGRADICTGTDCNTCGGRTSCTALGNNCAWDDGTGLCGVPSAAHCARIPFIYAAAVALLVVFLLQH